MGSGDDLWALPGVTYYYWVRACTESGCGEFYTYNYDTGWQGLAAPLITASDGLFSDKVQVSWPAPLRVLGLPRIEPLKLWPRHL